MIELGKTPKDVPGLLDGLGVEGGVYVQEAGPDGTPVSQLKDNLKVVLFTQGGRHELTTLAQAEGVGRPAGTYLHDDDYAALGGKLDHPQLRLYGTSDTFKKAWSRQGALLLGTSALGLLLAVLGFYFAFFSESPTTTSAVSERAQSLMQWVAAPANTPLAGVGGGGTTVARREVRAQRCLTALRGGEAKIKQLHGVECEAISPPFWRNKETAAIVAAIVGLLTTVLGLFSVADKFRFGQEPS